MPQDTPHSIARKLMTERISAEDATLLGLSFAPCTIGDYVREVYDPANPSVGARALGLLQGLANGQTPDLAKINLPGMCNFISQGLETCRSIASGDIEEPIDDTARAKARASANVLEKILEAMQSLASGHAAGIAAEAKPQPAPSASRALLDYLDTPLNKFMSADAVESFSGLTVTFHEVPVHDPLNVRDFLALTNVFETAWHPDVRSVMNALDHGRMPEAEDVAGAITFFMVNAQRLRQTVITSGDPLDHDVASSHLKIYETGARQMRALAREMNIDPEHLPVTEAEAALMSSNPDMRSDIARGQSAAKALLKTPVAALVDTDWCPHFCDELGLPEDANVRDVFTQYIHEEGYSDKVPALQAILDLADKGVRPAPASLRQAIAALHEHQKQDTARMTEAQAELVKLEENPLPEGKHEPAIMMQKDIIVGSMNSMKFHSLTSSTLTDIANTIGIQTIGGRMGMGMN